MAPEGEAWSTGRVQVYTGDGKGKTSAALGLVLRAVGAGLRVFIVQFVKSGKSSEFGALAHFPDQVTIRQYGRGFIEAEPTAEDITAAREGLAEARAALRSGEYQIVILDEANVAVHLKLFSVEELLGLIDSRLQDVEVVITGRNAHPELIQRADLVTEMRKVKHYYDQGLPARRGIEL